MEAMEANGIPRPAPWWRIILVGRRPKRTLVRMAVLVVTCFIVFRFVLLPIRVQGISMWPTYRDHSKNFVNRLAYVWSSPKRGDVVSVRLAGTSVMFMKRIVGLPGETIAFHNGHVFINGKFLVEPYMKTACDWDREPVTLGPDQYFVVGDNRTMPKEDHEMGEPHRDRIVGKVLL